MANEKPLDQKAVTEVERSVDSRPGPRLFKVIVIGDSGVGKTCLTFRFCNGRFPVKSEATIGVDFREKIFAVGDETIKLQLWDTAGQERFRKSMVSHYYRNVHAVVFVYDITKLGSFESLPGWIQECNRHQLTYNTPRILVGNKCDISGGRTVDTPRAQTFADLHNMPLFETSAKDDSHCDHVESIFMTLAHKLKSARPMMPEYNMKINLDSLAHAADSKLSAEFMKNECVFTYCDDFLAVMTKTDRVCEKILDHEESRIRCKSLKNAEELKASGNGCYKAKQLPEALGKYTEALARCPVEESEKLAVFYGNRSAAFFELEEWGACIKDVDRAVKRTNNAALREKLVARRSKCLQMQEEKRQIEKGQHLNGAGDTKGGSNASTFGLVLPSVEELLGPDKNHVMPCASPKVDLRWDEGQGRHVVAKTDLKPGDTVFVENPYASILLPDFHHKLCHFCHKRLVSPIPCDGCVDARFCDETCLQNATFHKYECRWAQFFDTIGVGHLALRVLTTTGARRIAMESLKDADKYSELYKDVSTPLDSFDYSSIWRLEHHAEKATPSDAVVYSKNCDLLIHYLESRTSYFEDGLEDLRQEGVSVTKEELISYVTSALLKHIHQLIVNAHAIGHVMEEPSENDPPWLFYEDSSKIGFAALKETKVATGIFPCAGMMNHSCEPNIATSFVGNTVVVRVAQKIKSGSDLFNCYGPFARRRPTELRKKELKLQYFFDCQCTACTDPKDGVWAWADAFSCQTCGQPVQDEAKKCNSCGAGQDVRLLENKLEESNQLWDQGMDKFDAARSRESLETLVKAMEIRDTVLYKHNRNRGLTYDSLAKCSAMRGDFEKSLFYLDSSLTCVVARFGDSSVEYGYELLKYLEVCVALAAQLSTGKKNLNKDRFLQNASSSYKKAVKIFSLLHGPWSGAVALLQHLRDSRILPL